MDMGMNKMNMSHNMNGDHNGNSSHGNMTHHMSMQMYFVFSKKATILFEEWDVNSTEGMIWSCVVVFLMSILYEGFKVFREFLRRKYVVDHKGQSMNGHVAGGTPSVGYRQNKNRFFNWHHFLQSFLHMIQVAVSYFLMLIAMTFNGWLFISVCVGAGVGYFLFSWLISKPFDTNEHCH